jgi:hypothetical protein
MAFDNSEQAFVDMLTESLQARLSDERIAAYAAEGAQLSDETATDRALEI